MKRPIDNLRNGPGSFEVRTDDDDSAIVATISIADERLLMVKERGIYEVKLADQIDPERTNINVPNTVQKILAVGADTPWVGAVVLTANGLFKNSHLVARIDCGKALTLVFEIAQHIARMHEVREEYLNDQRAGAEKFDPKIRKDRSLILPTVYNVQARCKDFLQKSDHVLRELLELVKLFYGSAKDAWTGLQAKIEAAPKTDNFAEFLAAQVPFIVMIRNARNAAEHRNNAMKIEVQDFSVDAGNNLLPPTIRVLHPKTPLDAVAIEQFMVHVSDRIVAIVELLMVFLCNRHIRDHGRFPVRIMELPEGRRTRGVRYGYGMLINGQFVPMS